MGGVFCLKTSQELDFFYNERTVFGKTLDMSLLLQSIFYDL